MFTLSSQTDVSAPSPAVFAANAYTMPGPVEILQLCLSLDQDNFFFTVYGNNINGTYYISVSDPEEKRKPDESTAAGLHCHEYYEFLFVMDGEIYQNIEHYRHYYPAGACCLVPPNVLHAEEYATSCRMLFFKITPEFLQKILAFPRYFSSESSAVHKRIQEYLSSDHRFIDFIPANGYEWVKQHIHTIFEDMVRELSAPSAGISLKMACLTNHLLMELFDPEKFSNTPAASDSQKNQKLFYQIRDYMENSDKKVTRAELEKQFHYSGDTIYKLIKSFTGLTITEYASYICIKKAACLLLTGEKNINAAAETVGFGNYTQFYREFRKYYHKTPREYRMEHAGSESTRDV